MYKGRVLLNLRIEDKPPTEKWAKKLEGKMMPFRRKVKITTPEPAQKLYTLKALVIMGTELPNPSVSKKKLQIRVSIGHYDMATQPAVWADGLVKWENLLMLDELKFPVVDVNCPGEQVCFDVLFFFFFFFLLLLYTYTFDLLFFPSHYLFH